MADALSSSIFIGEFVSSGTPGCVLFVDANGKAGQSTSLFFDTVNSRLGIGLNTPQLPLHIRGTAVPGASWGVGDMLTVENNGNCGIRIVAAPTGLSQIGFGDDVQQTGAIFYDHVAEQIVLSNNAQQSVKIDTTGNILFKGPQGPWADVIAWGAKADGVTDDTAAIQNAINSGAQYIYFPLPYSTSYKCGALTLPGRDITFVAALGTKIDFGSNSGALFTVANANRYTFSGFRFQGNGSAGQKLFSISASALIAFYNCYAGGPTVGHEWNIFFSVTGSPTVILNDSYFYHPGGVTDLAWTGGGGQIVLKNSSMVDIAAAGYGGIANAPFLDVTGESVIGCKNGVTIDGESRLQGTYFTGDGSVTLNANAGGTVPQWDSVSIVGTLTINASNLQATNLMVTTSQAVGRAIDIAAAAAQVRLIGRVASITVTSEVIRSQATRGVISMILNAQPGGGVKTFQEAGAANNNILVGCQNFGNKGGANGVNLIGAGSIYDTTIANIA